ncbi:MAG: PD-(D/E)XK nuclease family protein, partial [Flavobacteriaceae bacterium]|nr:PD-(D/E)XK nuclease family protein [Flavobacteriaceae bacterium]
MTNQKGFIDLIITKLREEESLDRYLFVLPNIRSAQALYRAIGQINKSSGFAPETITIDQLFSNIAGLRYADPSHQLLTLFSVYKEVVGYKDPFHKFSAMGSALLSDFNEIDQGLIHSEGLFRSLKQMGEMDVQFAEEKRSDLIKNHLKRIELIEKVYPVFKQRLLHTRQGYQGLVYQKAAEKVSQYLEKTVKPHVFIGFNAFSKAEQAVVANLIQSANPGFIFWDIDWDLLQNEQHEASHFIRQYRKEWSFLDKQQLPSVFKENNELLRKERSIEVIECPGVLAQCHAMAQILNDLESYDNTAVVLADESLLPAVIAHLPEDTSKGSINITMGEAIIYTQGASLVRQYLALIKVALQKSGVVPTRLLLPLLNHPLLEIEKSPEESRKSTVELSSYSHLPFFDLEDNNRKLSSLLIEFIDHLACAEAGLLKQAVNKAIELQSSYLSSDLSLESFEELVFSQIRTGNFSYKGDQNSGLQIMGILETRNLSFDKVIVLSLNEGIIPKGKNDASLIPHEMKRAFGLPTYKEKDAIYTYYFYRLLQKSSKAYLTFNGQQGAFETKEKSRLIYQLETHSMLRKSIIYRSVYFNQSFQKNTEDQIRKDAAFKESLLALGHYGFSPSSLSRSIADPLDFYKKYLLQISSYDELSEMMPLNIFGNIIHHTLESLYKSLEKPILTTEAIGQLYPKVATFTAHAYTKEKVVYDREKGRGYLTYEVIKDYVTKTLEADASLCENQGAIELVLLEEKLEVALNLPEISPKPFKIRGLVDRVDRINNTLRVVDYKT